MHSLSCIVTQKLNDDRHPSLVLKVLPFIVCHDVIGEPPQRMNNDFFWHRPASK